MPLNKETEPEPYNQSFTIRCSLLSYPGHPFFCGEGETPLQWTQHILSLDNRFLVSMVNGISTCVGYLVPKPSFQKNSSDTVYLIVGIRSSYLSQGYQSENGRTSVTAIRTHLLRCCSPVLQPVAERISNFCLARKLI